jgi:hypothetical protein
MSSSRTVSRVLASIAAAAVILGLTAPAAAAADITPPVTVTASPSAETVAAVGSDPHLDAAAEDSTSAAVAVEVWQYAATADGPFADLAEGVASDRLTLTDVALEDEGFYRAAFPDGLGGRVFSDAGHLDVGIPPGPLGDPSGPTSVAPGAEFTLAVTVTGDGPPSVTWQRSASPGGPWTSVPGAATSTATFTAPEAPETTTYYRAHASNPYGSATSGVAAVTTTSRTLTPVTSVTVTNPSPGSIRATWVGGSGGGASFTYQVAILDQFDQAVATTSTTSTTALFGSLPVGSYRARVIVATEFQQSSAAYSAYVAVRALAQTGTLSSTVLRPFVDGYQDTIALRATSTFPTSGQVRIRTSAGSIVRTFTLATATTWSTSFNGRSASGARLALGAYRAEFVFGGAVVATRGFSIASSQVGAPVSRWSASTVYPAKDGYVDTTRLTTTTSVPATVAVKITNKSGKKVFSTRQTRRMSSSVVWSGRAAGKALKEGRYKATITVKGGEGKARKAVRFVSVSAKKRTAVPFTGTITAVNAFSQVVSGDYDTGIEPGSLALWSSPVLGNSIYTFGATLPASLANAYSNVKLFSCGYSYSGAQAALLRLDSSYDTYDGWGLGNSEACYGGSWPSSIINGRSMYWAVGNVGNNYSFYYVNYFKVTCTRYVLK